MLPFLNDDPSLDAGQPLDQLVWDQLEQSPNKVAIIDGPRTPHLCTVTRPCGRRCAGATSAGTPAG